MVADVIAVLDAAGIHRAHVLGASLGGMVAPGLYDTGLALRLPDARTLVLHGGADTVVDPRNAKLLAARIPVLSSSSVPAWAACSSGRIRTASRTP